MNAKVRELPTASLDLHPEAAKVPPMPADQYAAFLKDVKARGIDKPLEVIPGTKTVIDGRTRLKAAKEAKLASVPVVDADLGDDSPVMYMLRVAALRRHLTSGQRAVLGLEIERELSKAAKERQRTAKPKDEFAEAVAELVKTVLPAKLAAHEEQIQKKRARRRMYVMRHGDRVKFGASEDPEVRRTQLATGCPGIELVATADWKGGLERRLFKSLREHSLGGEWYKAIPAVITEFSKLPGFRTIAKTDPPPAPIHAAKEAGKRAGVSGRYISDAKQLEKHAPEVLEKVKAGEITLPEAKRAAGVALAKPAKSEPAVKLAKPLAQIPGFPAALAAALEMTHIRTDVAISEHANREKGSHEERVRKVLAKAPGTHEKEVATATTAFLDHLYPSRKSRGKRSAEEQLQDLGLLPAPEFLPCPFCGTAGERLTVLGQSGVTCHECGAMGPIKSDATAARNAWNKRAKVGKERQQ